MDDKTNDSEPRINTKKYNPKLLDDRDTDTDQLGGHKGVSDAITKMIRTDHKGKSIALIGTWGSGKSSVIKMIRNNLCPRNSESSDTDDNETKDNCDYVVYTFDAWAHSGDTLRRAFLLGFGKEVEKWDDEDARSKDKNKLNKKADGKEDKRTLASAKKFLKSKTESTRSVHWLIYLWTSLIPICIALSSFLIADKYEWNVWAYDWAIVAAIPLILIAVYALFSGKKPPLIHENTEATLKSPEASSYEFKENFSELLKNLLLCEDKKQNNRKLLVVFDNLDRMETQDALDLWTTIQCFLELRTESTPESKKWIDRLWILVPFAMTAAEKLWRTNILDEISNMMSNENSVEPKGYENELAQKFIEKTFQAVFNVPPPLLSKWHDYFIERLGESFNNGDATREDVSVFEKVYQIYKMKGLKGKPSPTPREIKLFINKMVTTYNVAADKVELPVIAYYVCRSDEFTKKPLLIAQIDEDLKILNLMPSDFRDDLAALLYCVEKNLAYQILLGSHIEKAIDDVNHARFLELAKMDNFFVTFENVLQPYGKETQPDDSHSKLVFIINSAVVFEPFYIELSENQKSQYDRIWQEHLVPFVMEYNIFDLSIGLGQGLHNIIKHVEKSEERSFEKHIINFIVEPQTEILPWDISNRGWIQGASEVITAMLDKDCEELLLEKFRLPGPPHKVARMLLSIRSAKIPKEIYKYLKPRNMEGHHGIFKSLNSMCRDFKLVHELCAAVDAMIHIDVDWDWDSFVTELKGNLFDPKTEVNFYASILMAFLILRHNKKSDLIDPIFTQLKREGYNELFLNRAFDEGISADLIAVVVLVNFVIETHIDTEIIDSLDENSVTKGMQLYENIIKEPTNDDYKEIVTHLVELVLRFDFVEKSLQMASHKPEYKFIVAIIVFRINQREDKFQYISAELLSKYHSTIQELPDIYDKQAKYLPIEAKIKDLTEKVRSGQYTIYYAKELDSELSEYDKPPWHWITDPRIQDEDPKNIVYRDFRRELEGRLKSESILSKDEIHACLRTLLDLRFKYNQPRADLALRKLVIRGEPLYARLHEAKESEAGKEDKTGTALCLFAIIMKYDKKNAQKKTSGASVPKSIQQGKEFFESVLKTPAEYEKYIENLTDITVQYDKNELNGEIVFDVVENLLKFARKYKEPDAGFHHHSCFNLVASILKRIIKKDNWKKHITEELNKEYSGLLKKMLGDDYPFKSQV